MEVFNNKMHVALAALISVVICVLGYMRKRFFLYDYCSLSLSGALLSFFVGLFTFWSGSEYSLTLMAFYFSSIYFTKVGKAYKKKLEADYKRSSQRNAMQVFSNGGLGTLLCSVVLLVPSLSPSSLLVLRCCYVCHYCVCNGDTWASEIGSVFGGRPRLITTFKLVPAGTNGGVSPLGLLMSFLGGSLVSLCFYGVCRLNGTEEVFGSAVGAFAIGGAFGFLGSLIDSILGATLQISLYSKKEGRVVNGWVDNTVTVVSGRNLLDNSMVNFLSSAILTVAVGHYLSVHS